MSGPIPAISTSGKEYPSWDALVEAESNGLIVTAVLRRGKVVFTWSCGPFDKKKAASVRGQIKRQHKKDPQGSELLVVTIRPLWKDWDNG